MAGEAMLREHRAEDWEPILDGGLADAARAAARDVAAHLVAAEDALAPRGEPALFLAYATAAFDDGELCARYDEETAALVAHIERGAGGGLRLYGGLSGAAWTLAHIAEPDGDSAELLAGVDHELVAALSVERWDRDYDLIGGLTGYGLYFLERLASSPDSPTARAGIDRVVAHLDAMAERTSDGLTWHTPPSLLPAWQRELWPDGYYNCGVAHGVPGAIALLGRIHALPDAPARAGELCAAGLEWMRARRQPPDPRGRFPSSVVRGQRSADLARTAWCYGDPGIAAALWSASTRTGARADDWQSLAAECAARAPELCRVGDAGLCHGAIGLAHLYNRCYQASGDPLFRAASRDWFARGLAMRRPGEGVAGFCARSWKRDTDEVVWLPSAAFLDGAAGIGLALLAALGAEEPGWDRLLLCDLPC